MLAGSHFIYHDDRYVTCKKLDSNCILSTQ